MRTSSRTITKNVTRVAPRLCLYVPFVTANSHKWRKQLPIMQNRIIAFDVARAFAIYGMILVNFFLVLGSPESSFDWIITIIEGKAAATFVVLAGVGISLLNSKKAGDLGTKIILRRALFLFVFGLLYSPLWPADILHFYGIYLLIGAFLVRIDSTKLWTAYIIPIFMFLVLVFVIDYEMGWDFSTLTYIDFWTPQGFIRHLFYNGFHPVFPWLSFLMAGIWLGRQDIREREVQKKVSGIGIFLVLISSFASAIRNKLSGDWSYLLGTQPLPPFPFFVFMGTGVAYLVIIACAYITEGYSLDWLAETGRLSLTNYVVHVVLGLGVLFVLGIYEVSFAFFMVYSTGFFVGQIIFSHYWSQKFKRGPLEWLMRSLTG